MEFRNLTPFDALAFGAQDTQERDYHVVVMSVGYQLQAQPPHAPASQDFEAVLIEPASGQAPLPLVLADEHWGEPAHSSLKAQSDLVPYKPRCDVLVIGHAHSPEPRQSFEAQLQLVLGGQTLIDKTLRLSGPRQLKRDEGLGGWLRQSANPTRAYTLQPAQPTHTVPLRYELAFGGSSVVPDPRHSQDPKRTPQPHLINEVCYQNPLGAGWMAQGYFEALSQTQEGLPTHIRAPQIMLKDQRFEHLVQTRQNGAMSAQQMAALKYEHTPAGLGPINRAWAPRLAKAGIYDQIWLDQRHPALPQDFDWAYNNAAPADQQIAFPDLLKGLSLHTLNLRPRGGALRVRLPGHRAFVLADLGGARLPLPMQVDTIEINSDTLQVRLVWRTALLKSLAPESLELRFELNPRAALVKYKGLA